MYIKNLLVENFTNYQREQFDFSKNINILYGGNAQGKTNAVEGVFFLCTGYCQRSKNDKNLILDGKDSANLTAVADTHFGEVSVSISLFKDAKKIIKVNGVEIKKIGELMGNINAVFFSPSSLRVVSDAPEDRRRFMDISISQTKRSYFYALQKYSKILQQRNNLLKTRDQLLISQTLPIWDESLAPVAGRIIADRIRFLNDLAPRAKKIHSYLTDGKEELEVGFEAPYEGDEREITKSFRQALSARVEGDIEKGFTSIGPHRDDLKLTVNGKSVKTFGSQGQQRTTALSLKLAEAEIFRDTFGETPVLILDDVFSELDRNRQKKLIKLIGGMQTLITCAYLEDEIFGEIESKNFNINGGKIERA